LLAQSNAPRDARYMERMADIPNLVNSALEKFHKPNEQPPYPIVWLADTVLQQAPQYVIKGICALGNLVLIYGPSGDGKTFFTADLALHVACAMVWRGHKVRQFLCVYIAAEAGASIVTRMHGWRTEHEINGRPPFAIITRGANLLDLSDVQSLMVSCTNSWRKRKCRWG
jgi:hypothetical protein